MTGRSTSECVSLSAPAGCDPALTVHIFLAALMAIALARALPAAQANVKSPQPTIRTINPNVAPWYELTALPRVGESIAREIVHYRASAPGCDSTVAGCPFSSAADLDHVRGIGPITVRRIAPYLRFTDE
jgi:competence protein ComEA